MTDHTPNDISPQGEHAPSPKPLSPAAQAAWTSYETADCDPYLVDPRKAGIAAAIRALADQVVPEKLEPPTAMSVAYSAWQKNRKIRDAILAIANELENAQ